MWLALAAYASYVINAVQFVWKLRCARLQAASADAGTDSFAASKEPAGAH
jgi:3-vinyl bacteriochlorophyllide hydratase